LTLVNPSAGRLDRCTLDVLDTIHSPRPASAVASADTLDRLGDFTLTPRVLTIAGLATAIGAVASVIAVALLKLIGFFTNVFFFQRLDTTLVSPAEHHLGPWVVVVPVVGAVIIGFMARYGSERIRGHGIPEAIEAILMNGSRVEPKLAVLKPLSSAISIGSGGPFGAEGPIIMTGGAFGSLIAQFFHLTSAERKTLLVAGAAAGMSATFAAPLASVMLAVELLLFEWKPRSLIPVAFSSVTAAMLRRHLLGMGPIFPVPAHAAQIGWSGLAGCVVAGLLGGVLSALVTMMVYVSEDAFHRLPIHWMWWPAIGGVVIGIGGLLFPQALGVGYDVIGGLLQGDMALKVIVGVLIVKSTIWAVSLGSGTSGGVLAPLLMMGGALGGIEARLLPAEGAGFWPLVSMGATLGGTMRAPLTGVIFSVELTHDLNVVLPLLLAVTIAHGFTALVLRRSILTEKVSRRGYHLSCEYSVDPLEIVFAREVVRTAVVALPADATRDSIAATLASSTSPRHQQRLFPVVDADRRLLGVVTRHAVREWLNGVGQPGRVRLSDIMERKPVVAYEDEPLRVIAYRMAETGLTRLPTVFRKDGTLVGMIALTDLLTARARIIDAERRRERVLGAQLKLPAVFGTKSGMFSAGQ
jgi:H+/Cl- antiporter ClcA/CBS domain-containing protein